MEDRRFLRLTHFRVKILGRGIDWSRLLKTLIVKVHDCCWRLNDSNPALESLVPVARFNVVGLSSEGLDPPNLEDLALDDILKEQKKITVIRTYVQTQRVQIDPARRSPSTGTGEPQNHLESTWETNKYIFFF